MITFGLSCLCHFIYYYSQPWKLLAYNNSEDFSVKKIKFITLNEQKKKKEVKPER